MSLAEPLSTPHRVGLRDTGMLMTPAEYDAIEDWEEGYRYELVHGVLIVAPPADAGERGPNDELGRLIGNYQEFHANGSVVDDTLPEQQIQTPKNRRRADRGIWVGLGRQPVPKQDAPTIAVEFVSSSARDRRRDYDEKRDEYALIGIKEYWVIDRFRRTMTVFRGTVTAQIVKENDIYRTDLLPGFELPLKRLLERADRYAEEG